MSTRQLKEKLDEYQQSEMNLLDWDAKKRKQCSSARNKLFSITNKIELSERSNKEYSKSDIKKDIEEVFNELEPIQEKYDYSKLPEKPQEVIIMTKKLRVFETFSGIGAQAKALHQLISK